MAQGAFLGGIRRVFQDELGIGPVAFVGEESACLAVGLGEEGPVESGLLAHLRSGVSDTPQRRP